MAVEFNPVIETSTKGPDVFLVKRSADVGGIIQYLQETFIDRAALFESTLLPDLIHMSLNRAFRTRHRLQELVVYDFMSRYYESGKARAKNDHNLPL
jgi:hypothetical protein